MSQDPTPPNPPSSAPPPPPSGSGSSAPLPDGGPRLPWEERERLGIVQAYLDTAKLILTQPREAFSRLRPDDDYVWPLVFGGGAIYLGGLIGSIWSALFSGVLDFGMGAGIMGGASYVLAWAVLGPLFTVVGILIFAGICHVMLMATGSLEGSPFRFEGTFKAVAYSGISSVAQVIPFIGGLISLALLVYLLFHAFQSIHRTSQTNALITALVPIGLCCLCIGLFAGIGVAMGAIGAAAAAG